MLAEYRDRRKVPLVRQRAAIVERARFNLRIPAGNICGRSANTSGNLTDGLKSEVGLPDAEVTIRNKCCCLVMPGGSPASRQFGRDEVGEAATSNCPSTRSFLKSSTQADIAAAHVRWASCVAGDDQTGFAVREREDLADYGLSLRQTQDATAHTNSGARKTKLGHSLPSCHGINTQLN